MVSEEDESRHLHYRAFDDAVSADTTSKKHRRRLMKLCRCKAIIELHEHLHEAFGKTEDWKQAEFRFFECLVNFVDDGSTVIVSKMRTELRFLFEEQSPQENLSCSRFLGASPGVPELVLGTACSKPLRVVNGQSIYELQDSWNFE